MKGHLWRGLLVGERLALLARIARVLRLLAMALWLAGEAGELWLQRAAAIARRLGHQTGLEASGLLLRWRWLWLLAILRLPRAGAVAAP